MIAALVACSASDDVPAPMIAGIVPDHAPGGAVVTINGAYFCQRPDTGNEDPTCDATGTVRFGTTSGSVSAWSDTQIMVEVPQVAGTYTVTVVAKGRTSNGVSFTAE